MQPELPPVTLDTFGDSELDDLDHRTAHILRMRAGMMGEPASRKEISEELARDQRREDQAAGKRGPVADPQASRSAAAPPPPAASSPGSGLHLEATQALGGLHGSRCGNVWEAVNHLTIRKVDREVSNRGDLKPHPRQARGVKGAVVVDWSSAAPPRLYPPPVGFFTPRIATRAP